MSDTTTTPAEPTNLNPPSLLDDESLNESERQFIELFERRATSSNDAVDDGVLTSAEEEAETPASPPGTPADSTAAPVSPTQVEGPDDGGTENDDSVPLPTGEGDAGAGTEGEPSTPPAPAFTFAGQDYSPDDLARAVQVSAWHQQLSDQQVVAIDALLSGQYRLVANDNPSPTPAAPAAPAPATSPASLTADSAITDDDVGEWLDPRAQQEIARLQSQLSNLQSSVQQQVSPLVQQQMNNSMQERLTAIDTATQSFATQYALSEQQVSDVLTAATQAQILPGLLKRHDNNVADATRAALDMMFWTTPSFRDPYVQSRTAADLASLTEQERAGRVKQQQMTALSASGGSVPRRDPKPSTKEDRHSAMVAEIAAAQNGQ